MKILAVCQYYYPENFQVTPICEKLVRDGHEVTVLTGLPNYHSGVVPEEYRKGRREETINGVRVLRCYERGRGKGAVSLALNYLSFWFSSVLMAGKLKEDFDLVFVYQLSPVMMGFPGRKYARKHRVPMLLYCCDMWPESMKMYIHSEKTLLFRLFKQISKTVYRSADRIAVQSRSFIPYLRELHGIPEERMVYLPAFADDAYLDEDFSPEDETMDFVFLGNMGIAQNLGAVLEAVEKIREVPGFKVHFIGGGSCLEELKAQAKEKGIEDKVCFYGRRPVEEMPRFYKIADACLVSLKADNLTGLSMPAKVQGYMAAGKPIIGMIDGSAREVIEEAGCGRCVSAGDVEGLAETMRGFIEHPEQYKDCGQKGRAYFKEHFSERIFMQKLESEFEALRKEKNVVI